MGIFCSFFVFFAQTTAPLVRTYQNNDDLMLRHIHAKILINLLSSVLHRAITRPNTRQSSRGRLGRSSNAKTAQNSKM